LNVRRYDCFETFDEDMSSIFDGLVCERIDKDHFWGGICDARTTKVHIASAEGSALNVRRTWDDIRRAGERRLMIHVQMAGEAINRQLGREAHLRPGDICVADSTLPYDFQVSAFAQIICLSVPERQLRGRVDHAEDLVATTIRGADTVGGLVGGCVKAIWSDAVSAREPPAAAVLAALDLLGGLSGPLTERPLGKSGKLYERACELIERNKRDPQFSIDDLARQLGTSTRNLQRAFAASGESPGRHLLDSRISAAAVELASHGLAAELITSIAFNVGFNDLTHFERSFRRRYDCTPSAYRMQHR
jgi:AraC family transcriptional activator of tynA and feaB